MFPGLFITRFRTLKLPPGIDGSILRVDPCCVTLLPEISPVYGRGLILRVDPRCPTLPPVNDRGVSGLLVSFPNLNSMGPSVFKYPGSPGEPIVIPRPALIRVPLPMWIPGDLSSGIHWEPDPHPRSFEACVHRLLSQYLYDCETTKQRRERPCSRETFDYDDVASRYRWPFDVVRRGLEWMEQEFYRGEKHKVVHRS